MTDDTNSTIQLAKRHGGRITTVLVVLTLLTTSPVAALTGNGQSSDATAERPTEPAFVVDLDADGSARVRLIVTFDLTTDGERRAFDALRANDTARDRRIDRFTTRLQAVATRTERSTGRAMAITDPAITFATENSTGIVTLSVRWDGLAARHGDRLVLGAPFANGFDIDRPFRVVGPDGYTFVTATPEPTAHRQNSATWRTNTSFDGFEAVFAPAEIGTGRNGSAGTSGLGVYGFGISVAVLAALAGVAILVIRRR